MRIPGFRSVRWMLVPLVGLAIASPLRAQAPKTKKAAPEPPPKTMADAPYGTHPRQVIDFWKAESRGPAPLVVYIHGGGWNGGDKGGIKAADVEKLLASGTSVAAINYRLVPQAEEAGIQPPVKAPLEDAARAIQFLRSKAEEWNIDKSRIGATGGSAGACSSLWLALHDDMAQLESNDPIARESTRLACAAVVGAQTALDPRQTREWIPNMTYGGHAFGFSKAGKTGEERFQAFHDHRDEVLPWIEEYTPFPHAGPGDPPIFLDYPSQNKPAKKGEEQKDPTHSAVLGLLLEEKLREAGDEVHLAYPGHEDPDYPGVIDFLIAKLKPGRP